MSDAPSSSDDQLHFSSRSSSACAMRPRSILRPSCLLLQRSSTSPSTTPSGACTPSKCVHFAECNDEHIADEWDRSKCPTAELSFREIRELERIKRELVPNGRGITPDDECDYFEDFGETDVDRPKRRLKKVPIELCPILPAGAPVVPATPFNSNSPSPMGTTPNGSPLLTPVDAPVRRRAQPRAMMSFLPILPPDSTAASTPITPAPSLPSSVAPIPTPPETPTLSELELSDEAPSPPQSTTKFVPVSSVVPVGPSQHPQGSSGLLSSTSRALPPSSTASHPPK
ncbi:hypothetical protein FRB99_002571 [Tulasnella sp. 403]|nr:hypothetical protein FRB99_002571 [Tulasnella sp. 403]